MCNVQIEAANRDGKPVPGKGKEKARSHFDGERRQSLSYIPKGSPLVIVLTTEEYHRVPGTQKHGVDNFTW